MPGFPVRPLRDEYGPDPVNKYPVMDPTKDLDGETLGRLIFHQLTGLGLASRLAALNFTIQSGAPTSAINWRREAWNTKGQTTGSYAEPTLTRTGTGVTTLAYAANLPDWTGEDQPVIFYGGGGFCSLDDSNIYLVDVRPTSPPSSSVTIRTYVWTSPNWVASDGDFTIWLE
jgi:hypothetical protein